jgi:hypothetical protein
MPSPIQAFDSDPVSVPEKVVESGGPGRCADEGQLGSRTVQSRTFARAGL